MRTSYSEIVIYGLGLIVGSFIETKNWYDPLFIAAIVVGFWAIMKYLFDNYAIKRKDHK